MITPPLIRSLRGSQTIARRNTMTSLEQTMTVSAWQVRAEILQVAVKRLSYPMGYNQTLDYCKQVIENMEKADFGCLEVLFLSLPILAERKNKRVQWVGEPTINDPEVAWALGVEC